MIGLIGLVAVTKIQIMKLQKNWQMEREEFGFSQFRHGKQRIAAFQSPTVCVKSLRILLEKLRKRKLW